MTPDSVTSVLGAWGYPAYVVLFLATTVGSPITEDLLLLTGGYLVSARIFRWPVLLPLSYACVLGTDSIVYGYGRLLRTRSLDRTSWLRRVVRPAQLRLATRWFGRFGNGVVCLARLVPGTRTLVFVTAGVRGLPYGRFLLLDALASAFYVPAVIALGAALGEHLGDVREALIWLAERIQWVLGLLVLLLVLRHLWRRRLRRWLDDLVGS